MVYNSGHTRLLLTNVGHLGHPGVVGPVQEFRRIVVDVLHLDDELGGRLQRFVGVPGHRLRRQRVLSLLLAVQRLGGVDVARVVIDDEDGSRALARQDVLDVAVARVHVGVELRGGGKRQKQTNKVTLQVSR